MHRRTGDCGNQKAAEHSQLFEIALALGFSSARTTKREDYKNVRLKSLDDLGFVLKHLAFSNSLKTATDIHINKYENTSLV